MTDPDVERELEANRQRAENAEDAAEDDGPVLDTAERVINPLVAPLAAEDVDEEDVEQQRRLNDEEQSPD